MDALGILFERYRQPLYGFLYRLLHDVASAEDVTLDVFLRVYDRRHTYQGGGKFSTWLYAIAHHLAIDRLRQAHRGELTVPHDLADTLSAHDDMPAEACARADLAEQVRRAVTMLPEEQRVAILLREFQGLSYREIAEVLGVSEEATRVRVHRARQALRKALAPYCEEDARAGVTFSS